MKKTIRPTYPMEFSIGLLLLIFVLSFFLSHQIFEVPRHDANEGKNLYVGMFLVSTAVVIMLLVLWEEFLFPIHVKPETTGGMVFRNHRHKLLIQLLIYLIVPAIFVFIYMEYEVNHVRYWVWAAVCLISPVAGKLISGLNNYNDFLKLTDDAIEYKNNQEHGTYALKDVRQITLLKDDRKVLHKIQVLLANNQEVMIDLDEMELEAFYVAIDAYFNEHYKTLVKEGTSVAS